MIAEENRDVDARPLAPSLKLSTKASAFSIAAIIGEQSLARASDNVSPSGKLPKIFLRHLMNMHVNIRFSFRGLAFDMYIYRSMFKPLYYVNKRLLE